MNFWLSYLIVSNLIFFNVSAAKPVTHEDIRDGMISFVRLMRDSLDKLERHELRERNLGVHLKSALSGLDHRERSQDDLMKNMTETLQFINHRLEILEDSVRSNHDAAKGVYTVESDSMQSLMSQIETYLKENKAECSSEKINEVQNQMSTELNNLNLQIRKIQNDVDIIGGHVASITARDRIQTNPDKYLFIQQEMHDSLKSEIEKNNRLLFDLQKPVALTDNTTLEEISSFRADFTEKLIEINRNIESRLANLEHTVVTNERNLLTSVKSNNDLVESSLNKLQNQYEDLTKNGQILEIVQKSLEETAENVIDTKRRIEFGIQQVMIQVGDYVKTQGSDLNDTVNTKFKGMANTILEYQNGAVGNLTSKVENEISQVWRQIGIMYQQIIDSAGVLRKMQNQTETSSVENDQKIEIITSKLEDIGSNLGEIQDSNNFIVGRLSLFSHEFNETRNALADASRKITDTYNEKSEADDNLLSIKPLKGDS